jgi:hypothetical protein
LPQPKLAEHFALESQGLRPHLPIGLCRVGRCPEGPNALRRVGKRAYSKAFVVLMLLLRFTAAPDLSV